MAVPTGCDTIDRMLDGGLPERRTTLVTGGPGLGKSTLGMQFLQSGLDQGESCVYISTEQTKEEIQSSFANFEFEIDHPNLTVTSVHARQGQIIETGEERMTLQTIEGDTLIGNGHSAPFETEYIAEYLERFGPCDRLVFDSISGLAVMTNDPYRMKRSVLDLIRLFTDDFEATTLLTAEGYGPEREREDSQITDVLEFAAHGVIQLWRERVRGKQRRFIKILKMRGVDHDTREYELDITSEGVDLSPENWTHQIDVDKGEVTSTSIAGLDELCGGGLVKGDPVLLEHDGRAPVDALVVSMAKGALDSDMSVWINPSPVLTPGRFTALLPDETLTAEMLLDQNRLFVLDVFNAWGDYADHPNVYRAKSTGWLVNLVKRSKRLGLHFAKNVIRNIDDRIKQGNGDRTQPVFAPMYTEAFLHMFSDAMQIRSLYYWALEEVMIDEDTAFYIHNPATMDPKLAEFFAYDASQTLETWKADSGIQYLLLDKSPIGSPGQLSVVEYTDEPPYVQVMRPMGR